MRMFAYYVQHYWLSGILVLGMILAGYSVYRKWDKIVVKGSGRK
ncbi:hypothetical protein B2K_34705 [Paenibacillus mucilaginosus K02]|uniref:Uncharacterized protein n=1 Tax=Paenibacillus mucilaginosus K02 TaxID=997761 RepID=I0BTU9_9BACL|nr:hypothetical protein B2K_34705 [Paenibacillus mucilaginosus K02]